MAHELLINDDQASKMHVGGVSWNSLGKKLEPPATAKARIVNFPLHLDSGRTPPFRHPERSPFTRT
jgi:hypothetical protein